MTRGDVLPFLEQRDRAPVPAAAARAAEPVCPPCDESIREEITRKPMTPIRRRIAERLLKARQTTAMLTTFNEIDMSARDRACGSATRRAFQKKHGVALGFMSFFVKAAIEALKAVPEVNA